MIKTRNIKIFDFTTVKNEEHCPLSLRKNVFFDTHGLQNHLLPDIFCVKVRLYFVTRHKSQIPCSPFLRSSLFLQPFRLRFSAIVSFCLVYSWLNYSSFVVICN